MPQAVSRTHLLALLVFTFRFSAPPVEAQDGQLNVLIVVAHQDDYAMFPASVYKITHTLGGNVDLALLSDGSGGFAYSQLAEPIYHLELTDEKVARQHLSEIRNREMQAGGSLIGIRDYFLLNQYDREYTEDIEVILDRDWDADDARNRLVEIMEEVPYDFVFVHLPVVRFHAEHKLATILALEAAQRVSPSHKPVVLGSHYGESAEDTTYRGFVEHPGYPITRVRSNVGPFVFDRTEKLDPTGRLDYHILVNWVIAEHKSQGTMQLYMNTGDVERFWWFDVNDPARLSEATELFERLAEPVVTVAGGN